MTVRHLHLMGIGGVGMCGIAEVLLGQGLTISGCDLSRSERTERLESLDGVTPSASTTYAWDVLCEDVAVVASRGFGEPQLPRELAEAVLCSLTHRCAR